MKICFGEYVQDETRFQDQASEKQNCYFLSQLFSMGKCELDKIHNLGQTMGDLVNRSDFLSILVFLFSLHFEDCQC